MFKWRTIIIAVFVVFLIVMLFVFHSHQEIEEYKLYLKSLDAEAVIREHFANINSNDEQRIKETVGEKCKDIDWNHSIVESINILSITKNRTETEKFAKENAFLDAAVFDVTYEVKYKQEREQNNGVYTWKYYLSKESYESAWLIEEYGF